MSITEYRQHMAEWFDLPVSRFDEMNKEEITYECVNSVNNDVLSAAFAELTCCVIKFRDKLRFFEFSTTLDEELHFMCGYLPDVDENAALAFERVKKLDIVDLYCECSCGHPTWSNYILRVTDDELLKSWEFVQSVHVFQVFKVSRTDSFVTLLNDGTVKIKGISCYTGCFNWDTNLPHGHGTLFFEGSAGLQTEDGEQLVAPSDAFELIGKFTYGLLNGPGVMKMHDNTVECIFRLSVPYRTSTLDWTYEDLQSAITRSCEGEHVLRSREHLRYICFRLFVTYDCLICIRNMVDNITCSASAKVFLVEVFFMIAGRPRFMDTEQWRSTWRKVQLFCTSRLYFDQGATLENMPFPTGVISFLQSEPFTLDEMQ